MCVHAHESVYVIKWIHAMPDIFIIGETDIWHFNNVSIEQKLEDGAYIILRLIVF